MSRLDWLDRRPPIEPSWFEETQKLLWNSKEEYYYLDSDRYRELVKYLEDHHQYCLDMGWKPIRYPNSVPAFVNRFGTIIFKEKV